MQSFAKDSLIVGFREGAVLSQAAITAAGVEVQGRVGSRGAHLLRIVDGTPAKAKAAQLRQAPGEQLPRQGHIRELCLGPCLLPAGRTCHARGRPRTAPDDGAEGGCSRQRPTVRTAPHLPPDRLGA